MPRSLEVVGLRKEYPGTVALDGVSLAFEGGRVHALLGKNGAGKSTLVKILAGTLRPTAGRILVDGREVALGSAQDAFREGIAAVYQELSLVPGLTVAENVFLGRWPRRKGFGGVRVDWPDLRARAGAVLEELGVPLDVRTPVGGLGVARQQLVEIAKAMSFRPSVLMLDEPTSALARHETEALFRIVRRLASQGVVVLYITHRLQELPQIADRVHVLRDGRHAGSLDRAAASPEEIVRLMFGEVPRASRPAALSPGAEPVLSVRGLGSRGKFHGVTFVVRRGEILGIAGMLGSGRTELLRAVFGADPFDEGEVVVGGRVLRRTRPRLMKSLGVAFTPEERQRQGLVQVLSSRENLGLAGLERLGPAGLVLRSRERALVAEAVGRLDIKVPDAELPVGSLSGGNQQKVVVGKWLAVEPRVVLMDEPTRGIDVQAKQQIFQILGDLSRRGIASVVVSSELEELLAVCHRVLIMKQGAIAGEVRPEETAAEELYVRCMEA